MVHLSNMSGDEHLGVFSESNKDIIYEGWRVGATMSWSLRETPDVVFIHPSNMTWRRVEADSFRQCDRLFRMDLGRLVEIGIWNSFHLAQCEVHDLGIDQRRWHSQDSKHGTAIDHDPPKGAPLWLKWGPDYKAAGVIMIVAWVIVFYKQLVCWQ